jgi:hypothetical protein
MKFRENKSKEKDRADKHLLLELLWVLGFFNEKNTMI